MKNENKTKSQLVSELKDLRAKTNEMCAARNTQDLEALGILTGGIAHEFNNVLGAIIGYAEIMEIFNAPKDEETKSRIKGILRSAYRAKDLVQEMIAISRRRNEETVPVHFDLMVNESLKHLESSLSPSIQTRKKLICSDAVVAADPFRLYQILHHLYATAAESMEASGGILTVALEPLKIHDSQSQGCTELEPGSYVMLTVMDTGAGIPQDNATRKERELSIVNGIVKKLNGTVEVNSRPGNGSVFKVTLPMAKGNKDQHL